MLSTSDTSHLHSYCYLVIFCRTISTGEKRITTVEAELNENSAAENFHAGTLEGKGFVMDNRELGDSSLHFDADTGPYITHKDKAFKDGTVVPPRVPFTKCSFHENSRTFIGILDYGGKSIDGSTEVAYEVIFDAKYLCVVSGLIGYKKASEWGNVKVFGDDVTYTKTDLETLNKENEERLRGEGASEKSIRTVCEQFRKYYRVVTINHLVVWMNV